MQIYVTKPGDTLTGIARKFNVDLDELIEINDIKNVNSLVVGQALIIETDFNSVYIVKPGDTLSKIARENNMPLLEILDLNPTLQPPYRLYVGQRINVEPNEEARKNITLNGFAYSTSSSEEVANALTDLTYLSIFAYRYDENGHLIDLNDKRLVELSKYYETMPLLTITNQNEKGSFSSDYADKLFKDEDMQKNLIEDLTVKVRDTRYSGVIVDFEYIYPRNMAGFIDFISKLRESIKQAGDFSLLVALAPKYSSSQKGILYEAHDYQKIGKLADYVILMAYEWGYTYGPPMAVAPLPEVKKVVEYATRVIDKSKILLGYPNYGYDFTLPYEQGKSKAKSVDNRSMPELAKKYHAIIQYDEYQQSPYFTYTSDGVKHIVYFTDARSIQAEAKLVEQYDLGGISVWSLNKYYAPIFEIITNLYIVKKK